MNNVGERILHGQWSSPAVGKIGDTVQVVMGEGDGYVRGYEAETGKKLWEFDLNPKDSVWPKTRNEVIATPVIWENKVFIANGQDPEHGEGVGHLYAIDATKRGDITETGRLWQYDKIRRSISTGAIYNGLLFYSDFSGFLHCLDVNTGQPYWTHDLLSAVWGSPMVINGKVYLGDEDGDVYVLEAAKEKKLISTDQHGQFGVCDGGAGQRHALRHEPQRAVGAKRKISGFTLDLHTKFFSVKIALPNSGCWPVPWVSRVPSWFPIPASDPTGYLAQAIALLTEAGIAAYAFHDFSPNPDTEMVEGGRIVAAADGIDSLVALGGGSSLDCAKGINFVLTNGGVMRDYWGFGKAARPMLPMIAIPTTAGTGSEAQSYALISDADTHVKMACGDPKAAFRAAILDPLLTRSQPRDVTATAGYDAISHAVESYVTTGERRLPRLRAGGMAAAGGELRARAPRSRAIWKRAARCCWARTTPASPSRTPCSAPRTPAPIR